MEFIVAFIAGAAAGVMGYRYMYAEKFREQDINCNEADRDKELYRQLERLMAYSGKEG